MKAPSLPAPLRRIGRATRGIWLVLALGATWSLMPALGGNADIFVPLWSVVGAAIELHHTDNELVRNALASLGRVGSGFAVGGGMGLLLGTALALSRAIEGVVAPVFNAIRQVPLFGWIPLIGVWFGMGESSKLVFVSLAAFYPMTLNAHEGMRRVSRTLGEVGTLYRLNAWQRLRWLLLPGALPSILTGVRQAMAFSWMATVGAEVFMTSGPGFGGLLEGARHQFRIDQMLLAIVMIGSFGFLMNLAVNRLESLALRRRAPRL